MRHHRKEIHAYLDDEVKELADTQMTTYEETCLKLKQRYDGYHFTAKSEGIYNPFSLLNTFAKMEFGDYWFETGTPSYLVELLKAHPLRPLRDGQHGDRRRC